MKAIQEQSLSVKNSDPLFDVQGRVVAVSGGCGLVGRELACQFARRGAQVVIIDVPEAKPRSLAGLIGAAALGLEGDVSRADQVATLLRELLRHTGRVDVLVNCQQHKPEGFLEAKAESFPEKLWDSILEVNLKGTFLMCRDFGAQMLGQGKGSIVNVASTYGVISSNPGLYIGNTLGNPLAYSASKGGVIMLTKYLGVHWAARGVRVNAVSPHGVWNGHEEAFVERFSAMSPMKRLSHADEVFGAVLFLASDAASYVTGSNVLVEGGWTAW